jgi:three-Cys-motif partner protein
LSAAPVRCFELEKLKTKFPTKASSIQIRQGDANENLVSWVGSQNWKKTRAVVFLDPYGMQVEWETLKALGQTCGVVEWISGYFFHSA